MNHSWLARFRGHMIGHLHAHTCASIEWSFVDVQANLVIYRNTERLKF